MKVPSFREWFFARKRAGVPGNPSPLPTPELKPGARAAAAAANPMNRVFLLRRLMADDDALLHSHPIVNLLLQRYRPYLEPEGWGNPDIYDESTQEFALRVARNDNRHTRASEFQQELEQLRKGAIRAAKQRAADQRTIQNLQDKVDRLTDPRRRGQRRRVK